MKIGIVGLPNVGKSTLFSALTKQQVSAENYPFCTIDPNVGVVLVPDPRIQALSQTFASAKEIPAVIEFVDIAGLVAGAHKGEGLGNKFLSHIREVDAIAHVVRYFHDDDVSHVHGTADPGSDQETIETELILADLQIAEKRLATATKDAKSGDKQKVKLRDALQRVFDALSLGKLANTVALDADEKLLTRDLNLLTAKPFLIVENVDEDELKEPSVPGHIKVSAKIEAELTHMDEKDAKEYLASLGVTESGLSRLIKASYELLGLLTFFTAGEKETRAWTAPRGTKAPQAAGVIHTDFEKGFIRAEVIGWKELVDSGSYAAARDKGLLRMEGKDYVIQDGDVVHFHFS